MKRLATVLLICSTALWIGERHRPAVYEFHTILERGQGYVVRCNLYTGDVEKLRGEGFMYRQESRKSAEEILGIQAPLTSNRNCE